MSSYLDGRRIVWRMVDGNMDNLLACDAVTSLFTILNIVMMAKKA